MAYNEDQTSIPPDVKAQFDKIVGKTNEGGYLARIFDPYVDLRKFIEKHQELIPEGFGVLAGSNNKKHLNLIRQVMEGNPDSVEAGFQALVDNNSENAFAFFRGFVEDNPKHSPKALRVLSEYLKAYDLDPDRERTVESEIKREKGFNILQIKGLAETILNRPEIYGSHPIEMLEFFAEYAAVKNEETIKSSYRVSVEKVLRAAEGDTAFFEELSSEQRDSVQSSLLRLWELESVTHGDLNNFDRAVEKKTGTGLGFVMQWRSESADSIVTDIPQSDVPPQQPDPSNLH